MHTVQKKSVTRTRENVITYLEMAFDELSEEAPESAADVLRALAHDVANRRSSKRRRSRAA